MRVVIEQRKVKRGWPAKYNYFAFCLSVEFSEEEREIIIEDNLMDYMIHQRDLAPDKRDEPDHRSNLTVHSLIRMGSDFNEYLCERAVDAANAEIGAKEGLKELANYFDEARAARKILRGE